MLVAFSLAANLLLSAQAPSGVFFEEGWEDGKAGSFNSAAYGSLNASGQFQVQSNQAASGARALRHAYAAGQTGDQTDFGTQHFADAITGPVRAQGPALMDVYAQWKFYYEPGWNFASANKQFIMGTQDSRRHENVCCNPWVAHYMTVLVGSSGELYAEGNNKQASNGQWINLTPNVGTPARLTTGRWYTVEVHRRLNDLGVDNGVFEMWLDGVRITNRTNVRWRTAWNGTFGSDASFGTNFLMLSGYLNGPAPSAPQGVLYDGIKISRSYIGLEQGLPSRPTNLRIIPGFDF